MRSFGLKMLTVYTKTLFVYLSVAFRWAYLTHTRTHVRTHARTHTHQLKKTPSLMVTLADVLDEKE